MSTSKSIISTADILDKTLYFNFQPNVWHVPRIKSVIIIARAASKFNNDLKCV